MSIRVVTVLACLVCAVAPVVAGARDAPGGARCLPPESGDVVAAAIRSDRVLGLLPPGWSVTGAVVERDHVVVTLDGPPGLGHEVRLERPDEADAAAGRSFSVRPVAGDAGAAVLLAVGRAVDAEFKGAAWAPCGEVQATSSPGGIHWRIPPWLALLLAAVQWVGIAIAVVFAIRRPA